MQVRLQIIKDLVVTKVRILWEIENGFVLLHFIVFVVIDLDQALADEKHLFEVALVADHSLAWVLYPAEHVDDHLVSEAPLTLLEEVAERSFELLEDSGVLNQVSLHLWGYLLVKWKLLDHQVEVVQERLLYVLANVVVQSWLDVIGFVRLLNLLDPHVQRVQLFLDKVVEVVGCVEDAVD